MTEIINVYAREILDSRGNPTVEAEVTLFRELPAAPPYLQALPRESTKCWSSVTATRKDSSVKV